MKHDMLQKAPKRIQRKRVKGYRTPSNTVYVGRPSIFGNPFPPIKGERTAEDSVKIYYSWLTSNDKLNFQPETRKRILDNLHLLKGKNLSCWCKEEEPCHADVLLRMAAMNKNNRYNTNRLVRL